MKIWRTGAVLALASTMFLSGCFLKKRKPPVPPQAQAPTVETTTPPPATTPTQPEPQPAPTTTTPAKTEPPPAVATKKPRTKHHKPAKTEPATTAKATTPPAAPPRKVVVPEGGAPDTTPQLSASLPRETVSHDQQNTQQLLDSAEANLRSLNRQLSAGEQQTVLQIRSYMQQSRQATTDGDAVRAHNLALKAHLLSDQLVNQ